MVRLPRGDTVLRQVAAFDLDRAARFAIDGDMTVIIDATRTRYRSAVRIDMQAGSAVAENVARLQKRAPSVVYEDAVRLPVVQLAIEQAHVSTARHGDFRFGVGVDIALFKHRPPGAVSEDTGVIAVVNARAAQRSDACVADTDIRAPVRVMSQPSMVVVA